ncbi:hypothetical protein [Ralstonia phage RSP15]|uniref:translation repressor n=1 Tax=Ralstonia phage RSP15 TaxID=1785960 RepID=UPI00074D3F03|nr:translation repressor [Ralstonia phage RSP15]BAU40090.1 hypothetical protein [Ralstonia phage RSP15]
MPYLVEIKLIGNEDDAFLKVKETLTRIGIASRWQDQTLFQTCHILYKKGKYYIVHFKTMYVLDGRTNNLTENDIARQNTIIQLLQDWNLISVVNPEQIKEPKATLSNIKVVKFSDKQFWKLEPKYRLGRS